MKPQATLRFASFFAVNLAASLHAASVIQFTAARFPVVGKWQSETLYNGMSA